MLCPSAQPAMEDSFVFAVVAGTVESPRAEYLKQRVSTEKALSILPPEVTANEVYRVAAPCAEAGCQHYTGNACSLAKRLVQLLPAIDEPLHRCLIRNRCRWWAEQGAEACRRCSQIVTQAAPVHPILVQIALPDGARNNVQDASGHCPPN